MVPWCHLPFKLSSRYFISPNFSRWITIRDDSSMKNIREYKVIPDWRKGNNRTKVFFIGTVPIKQSFWKNSWASTSSYSTDIYIWQKLVPWTCGEGKDHPSTLCHLYIYCINIIIIDSLIFLQLQILLLPASIFPLKRQWTGQRLKQNLLRYFHFFFLFCWITFFGHQFCVGPASSTYQILNQKGQERPLGLHHRNAKYGKAELHKHAPSWFFSVQASSKTTGSYYAAVVHFGEEKWMQVVSCWTTTMGALFWLLWQTVEGKMLSGMRSTWSFLDNCIIITWTMFKSAQLTINVTPVISRKHLQTQDEFHQIIH